MTRWWSAIVVGVVFAVAGCGGDAEPAPTESSPSPVPTASTADAGYVDRSISDSFLPRFDGIRKFGESAFLQGEGWRTALSWSVTVRNLEAHDARVFKAFLGSRLKKYGTYGRAPEMDLLAAPGHEFLVTYLSETDGVKTAPGKPEPGPYQVLVGGKARPLDLDPSESDVLVVVSVPVGADATLRHTYQGRTAEISLRTGKPGGPAAGACGATAGTDSAHFGARRGDAYLSATFEVTASLTSYLEGRGWAKGGRCWMTTRITATYWTPRMGPEGTSSPPDGFSGLEPTIVGVTVDGRRYPVGATAFDVAESAKTVRVTVRPRAPRKDGTPVAWANLSGVTAPEAATITLRR
ncbi:hypothetical protein [Cryptosporangium arvum]|uniref:Uncharacterized protein n=1 Tax=Cryptosporangium arvum DSM 44712 TaxID=927661 RepID=A0A010Z5K2_9ACTN|nr:hypothetical protein [Cryptosporangium arvum]EXG82628.1 hypothetical protein CryarDRAFT_3826 [Cryptosporangium arvum DSM 44712]